MATFTKHKLSGNTIYNGSSGILLNSSTYFPTYIYSGSSSNTTLEEVWVYAVNNNPNTSDLKVIYSTSSDNTQETSINTFSVTVAGQSGLTVVVPGLLIPGSSTTQTNIKIYSTGLSSINVFGYINRIS